MSSATKVPILDHEVRAAVLYFFDLARRWLRAKPSDRTEEMTRILSVVIVASRRESVARDMEFVVALTEDVSELYETVRGDRPPSEADRVRSLAYLLDRHYLSAGADRLDALDATADEIIALGGPSDAARKNVGAALGMSATTIRNYSDKLKSARRGAPDLDAALADDRAARSTPIPAAIVFNWRQTLRAARAVRSLLVNDLDFPVGDVQRFIRDLGRRRRNPPSPF